MKRYQMIAAALAGVGALAGTILFLVPHRTRPTLPDPDQTETLQPAHMLAEPIQPIPEAAGLDPDKVALGKKLFEDKRLSHDNTLACASCHSLSKGGTDQSVHSIGIGGAEGPINAPTVLNSGLNYKQFWNGRAETLEDQADGPTQNPKEMGSNWPEILSKLQQDPDYVATFARIYPDGLQHANVRDAIATFERSLNTPNSPFDRYLKGDPSAISAQAQQGYRLFKSYGCTACHQGANMGGNMFQKMGVMADYFAYRGHVTDTDWGRYNVTHRESDRFFFRVPSLRNIALTAPYFHDGTAKSLDDAVEVMAKYQLGRPIPYAHVQAIVAFLNTLTGEIEGGKP